MTRPSAGTVGTAMLFAFALLPWAGCATLAGKSVKSATRGAVEGVRETPPEDISAITRNVSAGVIDGLAASLADPARQQQLRTVAEAVFGSVASGVKSGLGADMGPALQNAARSMSSVLVESFIAALLQHRAELASFMMPFASDATGAMAHGLIRAIAQDEPKIRAIANSVGAELGSGLVRGVTTELAKSTQGTNVAGIGSSVSGIAAQATAGAARGVGEAISPYLPECPPGDRACVERVVRALSRASAAGATEGVAQRRPFWPYGLAFGLGVLLSVLVIAALRLLTRRRRRPPRPVPVSPAPVGAPA